MLTKKQIEALPGGFTSNSTIKKLINKDHGHEIKIMVADKTSKTGVKEEVFIGNRAQYKYNLRSPQKLPKVLVGPNVTGTIVEPPKTGLLTKAGNFFKNFFKNKV